VGCQVSSYDVSSHEWYLVVEYAVLVDLLARWLERERARDSGKGRRRARGVHKLDLPAKTPIQPPALTSPRAGWITPKNSEVDRPDNVTIIRRDARRLHGSEPAHPTRNRVNAPHRPQRRQARKGGIRRQYLGRLGRLPRGLDSISSCLAQNAVRAS